MTEPDDRVDRRAESSRTALNNMRQMATSFSAIIEHCSVQEAQAALRWFYDWAQEQITKAQAEKK